MNVYDTAIPDDINVVENDPEVIGSSPYSAEKIWERKLFPVESVYNLTFYIRDSILTTIQHLCFN